MERSTKTARFPRLRRSSEAYRLSSPCPRLREKMCAPSRSPHTAVSTSISPRRPQEPDPSARPDDSPNETSAMSTNPSGQIVSMIACTRVRIA
jgi:hypothetical protein